MKIAQRHDKDELLGRQLSVLALIFTSSIGAAQSSPGARAAVINSGTMTYPGMPKETPMMFIKALSITEPKKTTPRSSTFTSTRI